MKLASGPATAGQERLFPYVVALLLLPVLVLWRRDDALYTPLWWADPWFYLGYFRDLVNFHRDLHPGWYYGSRLTWILPGWLLHRTFSPVAANAILHLTVHTTAVLALFATIRRAVGLRAAYLTAAIFSLHPWFWVATGCDYMSGGVIAYYLVALALLTRAAAKPLDRWSLILAGTAYAGALYAQLYMLTFAPLLAVHYAGLRWRWHGTPALRSLRDLCFWPAVGFIALTVPLCIINGLWVDGNFWFWTPSLRTANVVTTNFIWTDPISTDGRLADYLWFVAAASGVTLARLPAAWKSARQGRNVLPLVFAAHFAISAGLMAWMQAMGYTLLGHYHYACYLLVPGYLVLSEAFWPAAEAMNTRTWLITCSAATLLFGVLWISPETNRALLAWLPVWVSVLLTGGVLAGALAFRAREDGIYLAIAGLALLTALTYDGKIRDAGIHATRAEYERVMSNRQTVEQDRKGAPVTFWYQKDEPNFHEYFALNATYMAEFARVNERFPEDCHASVERGDFVVVTSQLQHTPDIATRALADCWRSAGMKAAVQSTREATDAKPPYTMVVLKAEYDLSRRRPMRVNFDGNGKGRLEIVPNATEEQWLPNDMWAPAPGANLERVDGDLILRTPPSGVAYGFTYAPLIVPETGKYRVDLRYRPRSGQIAFGAFPIDESHWLATDTTGRKLPASREMSVMLDLKAGETIMLRIANNNPNGTASAFVLLDAAVLAVAP